MGAGPARRFWQVTLPLYSPASPRPRCWCSCRRLGYFSTPALLGGPRVITLAMVIETQVVDLLNWSFASAIAMILLLVTTALVMTFDRLLGLEKVWG
jgi:ABC-type spermidine/putrescine transport system permease subunit I